VTIFGISFDSVEANRKFAEKFNFPYMLLCDTDKKIGVAYGAADDMSAQAAARVAYLIDEQGKIEKSFGKVKASDFPELALSTCG
jgi:peroxiredoxin Q/BCP